MKYKQQLVASAKLVMKVTVVQIIFSIFFVYTLYAKEATAQGVLEKLVTISVTNEPLTEVIKQIKQQTNANFSFSNSTIQQSQHITANVRKKSLLLFLQEDLKRYQIKYLVVKDQIVLSYDLSENVEQNKAISITGKVTDTKGEPLVGVTIRVKGSAGASTTDVNGKFTISVPDNEAILVFNYVGFKSLEIPLKGRTTLTVILQVSSNDLNEVQVVGYGTQKKINTTGAVSAIGTKELVQSPRLI